MSNSLHEFPGTRTDLCLLIQNIAYCRRAIDNK